MSQQQGAEKFAQFMALNRRMLDCYASDNMQPALFKSLEAGAQHDFCFAERSQVEDQLTKQKIRVQDFFQAAQS